METVPPLSLDRTRPGTRLRDRIAGYAVATAGVGLASGVAYLLNRLPHANLSLVFLTAVLFVASRFGMGVSFYASALSFLLYNFLFTPPYYTLDVESEGDLATLFFFLIIAAVSGNLTARMRQAIRNKQHALAHISNLYDFSRRLAGAADLDAISQALAAHLGTTFDGAVTVWLPDSDGNLVNRARSDQSSPALTRAELQPYWDDAQLPVMHGGWQLTPLSAGDRPVGLVAIATTDSIQEQQQLISSLGGQAAIAIERVQLAENLRQARLATEKEQLRSALLSSVSHDLRTPLAAIIGASTSLIEYADTFSPKDRQALQQTVLDEAERLNRYIQNLLDMTRLDRGNLELRRDWEDLNDLVAAATERLQKQLAQVEIDTRIAPEAALLYVHGVFIEQALVNIIDNAARYSPPGSRIQIRAGNRDAGVVIDVIDAGPGIPAADRERVFDMFYRVADGDRRQGTGLGLAISRGLVNAHDGTIEALPGPNGTGTTIRIHLPANTLAEGPDNDI